MRFLPQGYKDRVHWTHKGDATFTVSQGEHWDGSLDAKVKPAAVSVKVRESMEQAGIAWRVVRLPSGREVCLPRRLLEGDTDIMRILGG